MTSTIEYQGHVVEDFDPENVAECVDGAPALPRAFEWSKTPQGHNFWSNERDRNGNHSQEARDALIEMLYLWNEQHPDEAVTIPWKRPNKNKSRFSVGDRVLVVGAHDSYVPGWIGMDGVVIQVDDQNDTVLPYEVRLENGSERWFGNGDIEPVNKEEIQDEVGRTGAELRDDLSKSLYAVLDAAYEKYSVKSVTINSTGITVEFHK